MVPSQQGGLDEQLNSLSVQLVDMLKNEKLTLTQLLVTRIYLSDAANPVRSFSINILFGTSSKQVLLALLNSPY